MHTHKRQRRMAYEPRSSLYQWKEKIVTDGKAQYPWTSGGHILHEMCHEDTVLSSLAHGEKMSESTQTRDCHFDLVKIGVRITAVRPWHARGHGAGAGTARIGYLNITSGERWATGREGAHDGELRGRSGQSSRRGGDLLSCTHDSPHSQPHGSAACTA